MQSLERELDRKLVCMVRQRFDDPKYTSPWQLPQTNLVDEETLRDVGLQFLFVLSYFATIFYINGKIELMKRN